jgi:anti-sigma B factor antagonist
MSAAPFRVELHWPSRDVGIVDVAGEIDMHTAQKLEEVLAEAGEGSPDRLIVDLSAVGFIDSIGLSVLVRNARLLISGGASFEIVCATRKLMRVFEIAGLDQVFTIHATRADAIAR